MVYINQAGKLYKADSPSSPNDSLYAMDQSAMEACLDDKEIITKDVMNSRLTLHYQGVNYRDV